MLTVPSLLSLRRGQLEYDLCCSMLEVAWSCVCIVLSLQGHGIDFSVKQHPLHTDHWIPAIHWAYICHSVMVFPSFRYRSDTKHMLQVFPEYCCSNSELSSELVCTGIGSHLCVTKLLRNSGQLSLSIPPWTGTMKGRTPTVYIVKVPVEYYSITFCSFLKIAHSICVT